MRKKQIYVIILLMMAVSIYFIRCSSDHQDDKEGSNEITRGLSQDITPPLISEDWKELKYYSINSKTGQLLPVTAFVFVEEITPLLIVDNVIDSMEDAAYYIEVDSVTTQEDTVIISFSADTPPCKNVSKEVETTILDAIAQSLLDNLGDYKKIIFRIEDEPYQSEYKSFSKDYVYLEK